MKIMMDTVTDEYAYVDLGAGDADFYFRMYFTIPAWAGYPDGYSPIFGTYPGIMDDALYRPCIMVHFSRESDTVMHIFLSDGTNDSTNYFQCTKGDYYYMDIHVIGSGGVCTAVMHHWSGSAWDSLTYNGGGGTEISRVSNAYNARYINFNVYPGLTGENTVTFVFDDIQVHQTGVAYLGVHTCG